MIISDLLKDFDKESTGNITVNDFYEILTVYIYNINRI